MEVKLTSKDLMKSEEELKQEYDDVRIRDMKKLIFLENFLDLEWSKPKKRAFIKYFYDNLDEMNFVEALENFKKL